MMRINHIQRVFPPHRVRSGIRAAILLGLVGLAVAAFSASAQELYPKGKRMYEKTCALCHEIEVGPDLFGRSLPVDYVSHVVRNGFNGMPAFPHTHVDDETLSELAQYIGKTPAAEKEERDE